MWIDHGRAIIEMVHIDNVIEAITLSLSKGSDRDIYYVTDDHPMTAHDFFTQLLQTAGITPPEKSIPGGIARGAGAIVESIWKLFSVKSNPPISRFEVAFVAQPRRYNISRIKKSLGYKPVVSLEQGLAELRKA